MIFQVRGTTVITNQEIQVPVEAESQGEALSIVFHQYGKLRFDLDIYVESFMEPEDYPDAAPLNRLVPSLSDDEVIGISQAICDNLATREDYEAFYHYFKPMIKRQIYDLWRDMTEITASDMESDLITAIATEFMPRFDPTRGPLRLFIRLNIQSRLIKLWNREKYIGEDKTRTRADALKEYARMHSYPEECLDPDEKRAYVIGLAHRLSRTNEKMKFKIRGSSFGLCWNYACTRSVLTVKNKRMLCFIAMEWVSQRRSMQSVPDVRSQRFISIRHVLSEIFWNIS